MRTRPFLGKAGEVAAGSRSGLSVGQARRGGVSYIWIASSIARYKNPAAAQLVFRRRRLFLGDRQDAAHPWSLERASTLSRA